MIRSKILWIFIIGHVFFIPLAIFTPKEALLGATNAAAFVLAGSIAIAFAPLFWKSINSSSFKPEDLMPVGIVVTWAIIAMTRVFAAIGWYLLDKPMPDGALLMSYMFFLGNIGGFLHLSAGAKLIKGGHVDHIEVRRNGFILLGAMACFAIGFAWA